MGGLWSGLLAGPAGRSFVAFLAVWTAIVALGQGPTLVLGGETKDPSGAGPVVFGMAHDERLIRTGTPEGSGPLPEGKPWVTSTGKSGNTLRWALPRLDDSPAPAPGAKTPVFESRMQASPASGAGMAGLTKLTPGAEALLTPVPETVQRTLSDQPRLASVGEIATPSWTGNLVEEDPFTNPFADPRPERQSADFSTVPDARLAVDELRRGLSTGASNRREMPAVSTAPGGKEILSTGQAALELVLPTEAPPQESPVSGFAPLWLVTGAGQEGQQAPQQTPPAQPPELESTKPLADQLAAGPLVSPDICPKPASYDQELPEGLTPIGSLSHEIPRGQGRLPVLCPMSTEERPAPSTRGWQPVTFTWKASALCHKPAYFEQVHVERYGHSVGPILQPLVSGAHFFLTVPILPYKMGLYPPTECIYTLGHYRPGSCAPYMLDPLPLSLRAALMQAGAWTAGVFVVP